MIQWVRELERKLDRPGTMGYSRLRKLKEEKFQGNIRINFNAGKIASFNINETVTLK